MAEFERNLMNDLSAITDAVSRRIERKYLKGAEEHGGGGWLMGLTNLSLHARDELADQAVYLEWLGRSLGELDGAIAAARLHLSDAPRDEYVRTADDYLATAQRILRGGAKDAMEERNNA